MFTSLHKHKAKRIACTIAMIIFLAITTLPKFPESVMAYTGNFSTGSPFSCGPNCLGPYELFGHDTDYCKVHIEECFNTMDGCKDGPQATYEFVDNITITDLNRSTFSTGDAINIDVAVDCDSDGDIVSIAYHNGSEFRNIYNVNCSIEGKTNIYYNTTLDNVRGNHTVRAIIGYPGGVGVTCGEETSNPAWTDTDDVTFAVVTNDTISPSVSDPLPEPNSIFETQDNLEVLVCVNVSDNYAIDSVWMNVTWNEGEELIQIFEAGGDQYCDGFGSIIDLGNYAVQFIANDTSGNVNNTVTTNFTVAHTTNITVSNPTAGLIQPYGTTHLNFTIPDNYYFEEMYYSLDGLDNTSIDNARITLSCNAPDTNGTQGEKDNIYNNLSMSFIPLENMRANTIGLSLKRNGSGTSDAQLEIRTDDSNSPSEISIANGTILEDSVSSEEYSFVNITLNKTVNLTKDTRYWLFLTPDGSETDFYSWESSNDDLCSYGNYSNNRSLDLLFSIYDRYRFRTTMINLSKDDHNITVYATSTDYGAIISPTISFAVDHTSPEIISIGHNPNTSDQLDTGRQINFTINVTDDVETSEVVLQYKQINETGFTNQTASHQGSIYSANFTPQDENNWSARIIATDSSDNTRTGSEITLIVFNEHGWESSPESFNTTSALIGQNSTIGNITIVNNGDVMLNFNISKTESTIPSVYFNTTQTSTTLSVAASSNISLPVVVTGQSIESEQEASITIDALNESADPDLVSINFTFITFVSGPHLNVQITEYDPTVVQGQTRVTITARITNVGNETAHNISSHWEVPSGWTAKTNLTTAYDSLGIGQQVFFTRNINIESNATEGNQTIYVYVNCSEGKNDSDQRTVAVSSSQSEEQETVVISRGGGGGGGMIKTTKTSALRMQLSDEVELERGTNLTLAGIIRNIGETEFSNISLTLNGFSLLHHKISPEKISLLRTNESKEFRLFISAPDYSGSEKYEATLVAEAMADDKKERFTHNIAIIIFTEDKKSASECFDRARSEITVLESKNIATSRIVERMGESTKRFNNKEYFDALVLCNNILADIDKANTLKEELELISSSYSELGVENQQITSLITLSKEAFEREEYALAERRAQEAKMLIGLKKKDIEQTIPHQLSQLKSHAKEAVLIIAIISIISIFAFSSRSLVLVKMRLDELESRRNIIKKKINDIQEQYFVKKIIPSRAYHKEMEQHRNDLADLEKRKSELNLKRLKITSGNPRNDLNKIRLETEEAKKALQRRYYVDKTMDHESFKKLSSGMESILQDIDTKLSMAKKK